MICLFLKNKIHHLKLEIVSEIPASNEFKIWSFLLIELCFLMMNDECDFLLKSSICRDVNVTRGKLQVVQYQVVKK